MAVTLTSNAAERVQQFIAKQSAAIGLRVGVKKTGCSGYAYTIDYAEQVNDEDVVFDDRSLKVIVDPVSLELIDGTEIDFVKDGLSETFKFKNPKVKDECGCGESFTV